MSENWQKLNRLAELEGYEDSMDMLEDATFDSIVPAICTNEFCDYTTQMEPDQAEGHCEICGTKTVVSCLILGGVM